MPAVAAGSRCAAGSCLLSVPVYHLAAPRVLPCAHADNITVVPLLWFLALGTAWRLPLCCSLLPGTTLGACCRTHRLTALCPVCAPPLAAGSQAPQTGRPPRQQGPQAALPHPREAGQLYDPGGAGSTPVCLAAVQQLGWWHGRRRQQEVKAAQAAAGCLCNIATGLAARLLLCESAVSSKETTCFFAAPATWALSCFSCSTRPANVSLRQGSCTHMHNASPKVAMLHICWCASLLPPPGPLPGSHCPWLTEPPMAKNAARSAAVHDAAAAAGMRCYVTV